MQQISRDGVALDLRDFKGEAMPIYQVEKLYGDEVLSSEAVEGEDARKAAEQIAGRPVSPRSLQPYWYRVVDEREATVHEFSVSESHEVRDFANDEAL